MPEEQRAYLSPALKRRLTMLFTVPSIVLSGVVLGGGALGYLLDRWIHTKPLFTIILGFDWSSWGCS